MLYNCFRFAPRDSIPGLISKICKYLKDHPGWSEEELKEQINKFISATGVESFNGRTGTVTLDKNDVNNLKIASAYFAEGNESIDSLDLVSLYNQGVRFVFTGFNDVTSAYNLAFVLEYFSGSGNVVYYPMSTGSGGGGNIVSVNGKTGVVELSLADIVGTSGLQVKLCTSAEFTSINTTTWNAYYNEGYRIVGVVNSSDTAIDYIYLLKQDENNHTPIGLSTGASDAYTPTNPPPYPVKSVNGKTGAVTGLYDANNQPPYPVRSVNGKTGAVTIDEIYIGDTEPTGDQEIWVNPSANPYIPSVDATTLNGKTLAQIFDTLYPVGSIYITTNSSSPASQFGGSWEKITDCFLLAAGGKYSALSTGGEETHKLTTAEMPAHSHTMFLSGTTYDALVSTAVLNNSAFTASVKTYRVPNAQFNDEAGRNVAHNNMPPYLAVYMWKRVA